MSACVSLFVCVRLFLITCLSISALCVSVSFYICVSAYFVTDFPLSLFLNFHLLIFVVVLFDAVFLYCICVFPFFEPFFSWFMPDLIPNLFNGSIMYEFLSIPRCTLRYEDFLLSAISLFGRMINQGGSKIQVLKQILKDVMRHPIPFVKQIREDTLSVKKSRPKKKSA